MSTYLTLEDICCISTFGLVGLCAAVYIISKFMDSEKFLFDVYMWADDVILRMKKRKESGKNE